MNQRLILHIGLLIIAFLICQTTSILPFIVPISIICTIGAYRNKNEDFDSIDMFWLLYQLSFVLSPARSFRESEGDSFFSQGVIIEYWMGKIIQYQFYELALLFIILTIVALINLFILPTSQNEQRSRDTKLRSSLTTLFFAYLFIFAIDIQLRGGFGNVLSARHARDQETLSIFTIFSTSLLLSLFWLIAVKLKSAPRVKKALGLACLLTPMAIIYNPFNAARFALIQAWLPLILIFWPSIRKFSVFSSAIAFGAIILMPILSLTTRYGVTSDISKVEIRLTTFLDFLDQHTVTLHLIDMVERYGFQLGSSTISVLGFFIPRNLWPEKPTVIGLQVGEELYSEQFVGTPNLSGPIFLDYYYDFGIAGVVVGSILTALFFRKLLKSGGLVNGVPLVSYIVLAALPIVFRGSVGAVIGIAFFSLLFHLLILGIIDKLKWEIH